MKIFRYCYGRCFALSILFVGLLCAGQAASAATKFYVGADGGNWNTTASWSLSDGGASGAAIPVNGDAVTLDSATASKNINFIGTTYATPGLGGLTLEGTGGFTITLTQSVNNMYSAGETIGNFGRGTYNQSGGTNTVSGTLLVAFNPGSIGNYNLSNTGVLTASAETISDDNSTGTFTQSGTSTNNVTTLTLSGFSTGHGNYNLNAGTIVATTETVGSTGTGTFTQAGGINGSSTLTIANGGSSVGNYNLNGGSTTLSSTLTANTNGNMTIGGGTLNANGNITVAGGALTFNSGSFNWAASKTMTINSSGHVDILSGFTYALPSSSIVNITGAGARFKVANGGGSTLLVGSGSAINNNGASLLPDFLFVGTTGNGTVSVTNGGVLNVLGTLAGNTNIIGSAGNTGSVTVSGASIASFSKPLLIGDTGGSFTSGTINVQSGSSLFTNSVSIGTNTSSILAGGTVTVTGVGSQWQQSGSSVLTLGGATGGSSAVNIVSGGTYINGSTAGITVNKTGTINIGSGGTGGSFQNGTSLTLNGGSLFADATTTLFYPGPTFNIQNGGFASIACLLSSAFVAPNINTTVDGVGSTLVLSNTGENSFGFSGMTNSLTFQNGSTGTLSGTIGLADGSGIAGSQGILNVYSGAHVSGGPTGVSLIVGTGSVAGQSGSLTVDGVGSSFTQNASSNATIVVGAALNSSGSLNVDSSGTFTSGTGLTTINPTGYLNIGNSANYNANGPISVNGGNFNNNFGTFTSTSNVTENSSGYIGTNFGSFTANSLLVQNATFYAGESFVTLGSGGMSMGSVGAFAGASIIASNFNSSGNIDILNGTLAFGSGSVATVPSITNGDGGIDTTEIATVLVDGPGSVLNVTGNFTLRSDIGQGILTVAHGGTFTRGTPTINTCIPAQIGSGGASIFTAADPYAVINVNTGGNLAFGALPNYATINFSSGSFGFVGNLPIGFGANSPFGSAVALNSNMSLALSGITTIDPSASLTLNGGSFSTGSFVNNGIFNFNSGTLAFNSNGGGFTVGTGGPLGATVNLGANKTIAVAGTTTIASSGIFYANGGTLNAIGGLTNNGEIQFLDATSQLIGGTLTNNKLVDGNGRISNNLTNSSTGEVRASGPTQRLTFTGTNNTNSGKINLVNGGTVEFTNALTNSSTGQIIGRGTLIASSIANAGPMTFSAGFTDVYGPVVNSSTGRIIVSGGGTTTFWDPMAHNTGANIQVSTNSTAVFEGAVTGSGTFSGPGLKIFDAGGGPPSVLTSVNTVVGSTNVETSSTLNVNVLYEKSLLSRGDVNITPKSQGGTTARVAGLTVPNGGLVNLNDNSLIVDYTGATPAASIRQLLISGYGSGNWSGTTGVTSAIAHADASLHHTLGYGDAAALSITNFGGQTITGNAIVVKYTYPGDSNLDGKVDLDNDFSLFVAGYNTQISNPGGLNASNLWVSGDYNYDGKVDLDNDFSIFVDSYAAYTQNPAQLAQLDAIINSMDLTTAQKNALLSVVPEPGMLGLIGAGYVLFARRRRMRPGV